jgi:hypothetical protein
LFAGIARRSINAKRLPRASSVSISTRLMPQSAFLDRRLAFKLKIRLGGGDVAGEQGRRRSMAPRRAAGELPPRRLHSRGQVLIWAHVDAQDRIRGDVGQSSPAASSRIGGSRFGKSANRAQAAIDSSAWGSESLGCQRSWGKSLGKIDSMPRHCRWPPPAPCHRRQPVAKDLRDRFAITKGKRSRPCSGGLSRHRLA